MRRRVPLRLAHFACALLAMLCGCDSHDPEPLPNYHEYAYVTNGGNNSVTVVDLRDLSQRNTIYVGKSPTGLAANPKKNEVYVANTDSNSISVIDAENNKVAATIAVQRTPYFVEVSPDGKRAYVPNSGSASLSVIDLEQRKLIRNIDTGKGSNLVRVTPNGRLALVSLRDDDAIAIVDTDKLAVRSKITGCSKPGDLVIVPESTKAFVTCTGAAQVAVIELGQDHDRLLALLDVGATPIHIALKPDGGEIFVCNFDSSSVSEIITNSNEVNHSFMTGSHPARGLVSSDNSVLFVSNFGSDSVAVYSIDDGRAIGSARVGNHPEAMAFSANQLRLLVVNTVSDDLTILQLTDRNGHPRPQAPLMEAMVPLGRNPRAIVVKSVISAQ